MDVTRRIGLSLGADLCWPICFEEILRRLDLAITIGSDTVRFDVDRVVIEPFDLRQTTTYDLVVDRLTHWYTTSREWIKKIAIMRGGKAYFVVPRLKLGNIAILPQPTNPNFSLFNNYCIYSLLLQTSK